MMNLSEFHSYIADNQSNICQLTVIQNSRTVINDTWNGYKADDTVHTLSVTKRALGLPDMASVCLLKRWRKSDFSV